MYLETGQVVRWNFVFGGQLDAVVPMRVVAHGSDGLWLWLAARSPTWAADVPDGRHLRDIDPAERPAGGYPLVPGVWRPGNALIFQPEGAACAVWWLFDRNGKEGERFSGWYVNLEQRSRQGDDIHVTDHELDLVVAKDRSWRWKDEESFHSKTGHPAYWTHEEAVAVRTEGQRLARLAEASAFPFDGSWCDYRPPRDWALPSLPPQPRPSKTELPTSGG